MTFVKGELKKLYENVRMSEDIDYRVLDGCKYKYDGYSWENGVSYHSGTYLFKVNKDSILGNMTFSIYVDGILVFKNKWVHSVPSGMKKAIGERMVAVRNWNKDCKKNKLKRSHIANQKAMRIKIEKEKIEQHENEKRKLLEIFK